MITFNKTAEMVEKGIRTRSFMKKVRIVRFWGNDMQTLGIKTVEINGKLLFTCKTLERGWLNNQQNISCIPAGIYDTTWSRSPLFSAKAGKDVSYPRAHIPRMHAWCIPLQRQTPTSQKGDNKYPGT